MTQRQHERVPVALEVQFRSASSLLVAYSVNLSRGGMFLATEELVPVGQRVTLEVAVPKSGTIRVAGTVSWHRAESTSSGPRGIGVQFDDMVDSLGAFIDELVSDFSGVNILVLSADEGDRAAVGRMLRSIIATAEVAGAANERVAAALLGEDIDLLIVDVDEDESAADAALRAARSGESRVPTVALASTEAFEAVVVNAGADEIIGNPPRFAELREAVVRALGKPSAIRSGR